MRKINLEAAKPDMVLATDIIDSMGRLLLTKSTPLTDNFIKSLQDCGIMAVYIDDEFSKGIEIEEPITARLRAEGLMAVKEMDVDKCKMVARKIVEELMDNEGLTFDMEDLRTFDDYTFAHSVNVAVLSCTIGLNMRLSRDTLEDIVFAGLLHDLGKLQIPTEILNKPDRLTAEEFALIKTHPKASYDIIADNLAISSLVKNAVYCHHENYDGSGYPNGLSNEQLSIMAKILHIADVYDALTSQRPYKPAYPPFAAVEILKGGSGTMFDPELLERFLISIPIYPKGSIITLNYDMDGIVVSNSGPHSEKPLIRLVDGREIDLSLEENAGYRITTPSEEEFIQMKDYESERETMIKPMKRYKIMVLDHIGSSYQNISSKLSYLYEFKRAATDTQAEGYLKKFGYPDLIIVDADGRDFSNREDTEWKNRTISSKVPVIVLGSYRDIGTINMFRSIGISNYILKPFHLIYLQNEIINLLDEKSLHYRRYE